jgi:hypothetical protein
MTFRLVHAPLLILTLVLVAAPLVHARQSASAPLEERMSHAEFMRLGLDKLSPAQLKGLNSWLHTHGLNGPSMDSPRVNQAEAPPAPDTKADTDIHSRIAGTFHGWESGTVLTLANGQQWKVMGDSQVMSRSMDHPKVTLRKGFLGSWMLSVDGVRETTHVRRVH